MKRTGMLHLLIVAALVCGARLAPAADVADTRSILNVTFPDDIEITLALSGGPEHLRAKAGVYVFGAKGFTQVRESTNGFTCLLNRDGFFYGTTAFKPTCWDAAGLTSYVPVMLRVGELLAAGKTVGEIRGDIDNGFREARFHRPKRTGIAYMLAGDISLEAGTGKIMRAVFPGHYMIYAPGLTSADLGYSAEAARTDRSLPFVFSEGAGGAELAYLITVPHH